MVSPTGIIGRHALRFYRRTENRCFDGKAALSLLALGRRSASPMTSELSTSDDESAAILRSLSLCMKALGTPDFNGCFLDLIETSLQADQVMVFSYRHDRPRCYLSFNRSQKQTAENLSQKYLRSGYRIDPLKADIEAVGRSGETRVIQLEELRDRMSDQYWTSFFEAPGIVDKMTVLAGRDDDLLGINFYRFDESGRFAADAGHAGNPLWEIIAQTALLHFSERQPTNLRSPLNSLSDRERQICEAMLRGLTTDAIAWELGVAPSSVTTYRKRAYEKLGINSKPALFALCGDNSDRG